MKVLHFPDSDAESWNGFVTRWPDFGLLQSFEWGEFKQALGWKAIRLAVERDGQLLAGAQMLIKAIPLGLGSVAYIPRGPLLNWEDETVAQTLLSAVHATARQHHAIFLKIEPPVRYSPKMPQRLQSHGFRRSDFNNQPQCSMLIDLTRDEETILAKMHKTTRHNIHKSARKGVVVSEASAEDLDLFYRLIKLTAKRAGFPVRSREYFRREWAVLAPHGYLTFFLAQYRGEILAARMPVTFGKKAASFHSGSFNIHKNLKSNELLMWESLKWAKAQGCTTYDLWGIPDEIGAHLYSGQALPKEKKGGLWGVYNFKRGFGGDVIYYVGAYDFVYRKPLYRLTNSFMTGLGSLEKLTQLGDRFFFG